MVMLEEKSKRNTGTVGGTSGGGLPHQVLAHVENTLVQSVLQHSELDAMLFACVMQSCPLWIMWRLERPSRGNDAHSSLE